MGETRVIGGEEHRRRKVVRAVRVELEGLSDEIADLSDELSGLDLEIGQTGARLDALGDAEGDFDREARDGLLAERRTLRAKVREINTKILDLQSRAIGLRIDPPREPTWIDENVETDEMMEILTWLSDRPTEPSASESAES